MRFPPGVDPQKAIYGYVGALQGYTADAINLGIAKFLRGECEGVSPKYCPHPPELATIVRSVVVPSRVPPQRQVEDRSVWSTPGERDRMRLKMPLWRHAMDIGRMDELDEANKAGFGAMVVLARKWGVEVPRELLEQPEREVEAQWRTAGNRARARMEAERPPFMRRARRAA